MIRKFKTNYNNDEFKKKYDKVGGEKLVESAGYVSAKQRIENMILAGQRLTAFREEMYDINGETFKDPNFDPDSVSTDPTRRAGYDLSDAFQQNLQVVDRLKARKKEKKVQESLEETRSAQNTSETEVKEVKNT